MMICCHCRGEIFSGQNIAYYGWTHGHGQRSDCAVHWQSLIDAERKKREAAEAAFRPVFEPSNYYQAVA